MRDIRFVEWGRARLLFLSCALFLWACSEVPLDVPVSPNLSCAGSAGPDELDRDGDGAPDHCDNCVHTPNVNQSDSDFDGVGDRCDDDLDGDGIENAQDNCRDIYNPDQKDTDGDGVGDACDPCPLGEDFLDSDGDGVADCFDNCSDTPNPGQLDSDEDGVGDACDNCIAVANAGQADRYGSGVGDACAPAAQPAFDPQEASIAEIHGAILSGQMTCEAIIEAHLERIARFDLDVSAGAPINAFVMFNENVRAQARALDAAFAATRALVGPLHCVPIGIKTNYDSSDTTTTHGSQALVGTRAPDDGFALAQMRARGALLIGATTMDEFASGVHGIGGRHGKTGNAYQTKLNSGGSSAGSGAAVAAGFVVGATGTDNCGSLSIPAAYHGLVTMRSTHELVSVDGIFPSNPLDGVAGPIARSVRDLALLLDAMATERPGDPRQNHPRWARPASFTEHLNPNGLRGRRIGVLRRLSAETDDWYRDPFQGADAHATQVWARTLADLRRLGAEVVENVRLPEFLPTRYGGGWVVDVDAYLKGVDSPVKNFAQICEDGRFSKSTYSSVQACLDVNASGYARPTGSREKGQRAYTFNRVHVEHVMDLLELDALIYPADAKGAAQRSSALPNCLATSASGLPAVVVPTGLSDAAVKMPIGMMLMGREFDEATLIEMAYAYEQGTGWRRPPRLHAASMPDDVPQLNLRDANDLRLALGEAAFEQVLAERNKFELSPELFRQITRQVLQDAGAAHLLGGTD